MLTPYDWLRQSRTGGELLATLQLLAAYPDILAVGEDVGTPPSALHGLCERCGIYPRRAPHNRYCDVCGVIVNDARNLGQVARYVTLIWGYVNKLPRQFHAGHGFKDAHILGAYAHDDQHFLLVAPRRELKVWLQELLLYHGPDLKGLLQIFPTTGGKAVSMRDMLCRIHYLETRFPMDCLRVRFISAPHQIFHLHEYDRAGVLTFEVSEFVNFLEMAAIFRTLLRPEEQNALRELLKIEDDHEAQFFWGRFVGQLSAEAKDMLNAWKIRRWTQPQIKLLYTLAEYVTYY